MNKPITLPLDETRFARLAMPERIWAVGAIHAQHDQLSRIHQILLGKFKPGDRLVYLGNYNGIGKNVRETTDELLKMRRKLLARTGHFTPDDFVYLRGAQEEMWAKLLQLQFAQNPPQILEWMLDQGIGPTIEAYGSSIASARGHMRDGPIAITKWTSAVRSRLHKTPGHHELMTSIKRAAYTECGGLLFVHASLDPDRTLSQQGDNFWWDTGDFELITHPYQTFSKVIRGYDKHARGVTTEAPFTASIDGGCGRGGRLQALCFATTGDVLDHIEA